MKSAILFTGFVRSFSTFGEKLYIELFENFPNADVYFCCWDIVDLNNNQKIDVNTLAQYRNVKGIKILEWNLHKNLIRKTIKQDRMDDIFEVNRFAIQQGIESSNKIKNQWYLVNQAKDLLPINYYDVILRTRFDLAYMKFGINDIKKGITLPYNFFSNHYAKNCDISSGFCDHVAYGDNDSMFKYLSMYDHIDSMYMKNNVNISHAEGILKYYLTKYHNDIEVNMNNNILYQIVKNENDIDNTPLKYYELL